MTVVAPQDERTLKRQHYICSFCSRRIDRGAVWVGPNISICSSCLTSGHAADILGRILGDAIFAVYGTRSYTEEVERVTKTVEGSIYRILYNHARSRKG